jgi:hypothetical protein
MSDTVTSFVGGFGGGVIDVSPDSNRFGPIYDVAGAVASRTAALYSMRASR